ncbi:hypothetical protein [Spirosoma foliorum]|nr:hypothetical protein [Spirosoma foliorum]
MLQKWEVFYTNIPVSGGVRVGIMAFENSDKIVPNSFFVRIPKHTQPLLCVEISSRDGRYQAKLPFTIVGSEPGIYELILPTQYQNELKNYSIKDITILAKITKACDEEPECYVLSAWNSPKFNQQQAYVYLNTDVYTELILSDLSNKSVEHVIECEKIPEPIATAYNCLCKLSGYDLTKYSEIRIKRIIVRWPTRSTSILNLPVRF